MRRSERRRRRVFLQSCVLDRRRRVHELKPMTHPLFHFHSRHIRTVVLGSDARGIHIVCFVFPRVLGLAPMFVSLDPSISHQKHIELNNTSQLAIRLVKGDGPVSVISANHVTRRSVFDGMQLANQSSTGVQSVQEEAPRSWPEDSATGKQRDANSENDDLSIEEHEQIQKQFLQLLERRRQQNAGKPKYSPQEMKRLLQPRITLGSLPKTEEKLQNLVKNQFKTQDEKIVKTLWKFISVQKSERT